MDPGLGRGPGPAQALAVGEPYPCDVERPLVDGRQAQRLLEERGRPVVPGGDGGGRRRQDGQPGGQRRDVRFLDGAHMPVRFGLPVRAHGGFHQVHDNP